VSNFDELMAAAQAIGVELFLSHASICVRSQQEFFAGRARVVPIEPFRILNICSDIMREMVGYDTALDSNKAIETLGRQGFKVMGGLTADLADETVNQPSTNHEEQDYDAADETTTE